MKKKKILIILIVIAVIIAIAVATTVFIVLSKEQKPKTGIDFYMTMQEKEYVMTDAKNQFADKDYILEALVASSSDYTYKIEFYTLSDKEYATKFYDSNKAYFEETKGDAEPEIEVSEGNHSKYAITANGKYSVISKIENTAIYVNVDEQYKDKVQEALNELGY